MRAKEFLLEYDRQITAQNFGVRMFDTFKKEGKGWHTRLGIDFDNEPVVTPETRNYVVDYLLTRLEQADPTPHKEYVPWMARTYAKGGVHFEDVITQVAQDLQDFANLKLHRLIGPPDNDINRYRDFHDFAERVEAYSAQLQQLQARQGQVQPRGQVQEIWDDQQIRILHPEDQTAACYYGRGTRWCTAARVSNNLFDSYNKDGPLYIIIPKNPAHQGEKYQFHFESGQFMDEKDQPIPINGLVKRYPQLKTVFAGKAKEQGILEFFYGPTQLYTIYNTLLPKIREKVDAEIQQQKPKIAKEILNDMLASIKELKHFKEDAYDLIVDDIDSSADAFYEAIRKRIQEVPQLLTNDDIFYDEISGDDALGEFRHYSGMSDFVASLIEDDLISVPSSKEKSIDYYEFEVDQNLVGNLEKYYARSYQANWKQAVQEYIKL